VDLGPVADGVLWLSADGVGIAGLRIRTDTFLPLAAAAKAPADYIAAGYPGPIQILGVTASTVYFSVHRIPGIADGGYWAGLDAVPITGGSVRTTMPADQTCVQGGAGAPSILDLVGGRVWVGWSGGWCPFYDGTVGATSLATSASACIGKFSTAEAVLADGQVVAECRLAAGDRFFVFDGSTGAQVATFGLPATLTALGIAPTASLSLLPGSGGHLWLRLGAGAGTVFARINPTAGTVTRMLQLPGGTTMVAGATHDWFVGPAGVARATP
jgi:hypothetical protein